MSEQHCHLANKYEDIVNLQEGEAYGGHLPTAFECDMYLNIEF